MKSLPRRITGSAATAQHWCGHWASTLQRSQVLVLLAATDTAAIPGISAAGATPDSRRITAAADAELLLLGPSVPRCHALPPLPAGVTPALISHVVAEALGLRPLLVDLGCSVPPAVPHLRLPAAAGGGPARCLSSGAAMDPERVRALLDLGWRWGAAGAGPGPVPRPLLLAECVPGGTTTAQAVLTGLGIEAGGIVSGSLHRPAHALKADLVARGLAAAPELRPTRAADPDPARVLAAFGDPMQALAAGAALGAAAARRPVLLAGGSQMAAVLALALALAAPERRQALATLVALGTTAWVAGETHSDLALLLQRIGQRWQVDPLAHAAALDFRGNYHPALQDYERGYVKEGVGAGGLALLWELSGRSPQALARACDQACRVLLGAPARPEACPLEAPPATAP